MVKRLPGRPFSPEYNWAGFEMLPLGAANNLPDPNIDMDRAVLASEAILPIRRALKSVLNPRESTIVSARFGLLDGKEWTLEELSGPLRLSRERIRQIEARALCKLRHPRCTKCILWGFSSQQWREKYFARMQQPILPKAAAIDHTVNSTDALPAPLPEEVPLPYFPPRQTFRNPYGWDPSTDCWALPCEPAGSYRPPHDIAVQSGVDENGTPYVLTHPR